MVSNRCHREALGAISIDDSPKISGTLLVQWTTMTRLLAIEGEGE
jgi:hypothetical protein